MTSTPTAPRRPALPNLPKSTAVRRLASSLEERGLHEHSAIAIAAAVCDPTAVRRQLAAPGRLRVDGGYLEVVTTEVWTPGVLVYPTNPRALPAFAYQIEGETNRRHPLPGLLASPDSEAIELIVTPGVPAADFLGALDAQIDYLRRANDLRATVGESGIREPLLLLPLVIDLDWPTPQHTGDVVREADEAGAPALLAAVDGSSRITAAHYHLRLDPAESLSKHLGSERALRLRISKTLAVSDGLELSDEELAECRSLVAPASVIVGFVPDDPETDTLLTAINSRLGALHVDPPRPWSTASRLDVQLDAAVTALASAGRIDSPEEDWLKGRISLAEAEAWGFRTEPDIRAAYVFQEVGRRDSITGRALRTLTARSRIDKNLRAEIVAEGAVRGFRSQVSDTQAQSARSLLTAIYLMEEVQAPWEIDPYGGKGRTIAEVREEAWDELRIIGVPGPSCRRLLVQAGYWLARLRVVPRQTRGGQADRRDITAVLSLMVNTERGIRQLIQIIYDGRNGRFPRQVRATGKMLATEALVSDEWLRKTWSADTRQAPRPTLAPSPESDLNDAATAVRAAISELKTRIDALRDPRVGDGAPLVDTNGLETTLVNAMITDIVEVQMRLSVLKHLGEVHAASSTNPEPFNDG